MKKLKIVGILIFVLLAAIVFHSIHEAQSGEHKLLSLLNGDASVKIESLSTEYQQRRLECTDPEVLEYLGQAMMKHSSNWSNIGGYSYKGCFKFKDGGTYEGPMSISTNGFLLSVGRYPNPDELPTHVVRLISPVPEKVRQIFEFFDEPEQQAAGTVLILEPRKLPRREHDQSLVAK